MASHIAEVSCRGAISRVITQAMPLSKLGQSRSTGGQNIELIFSGFRVCRTAHLLS